MPNLAQALKEEIIRLSSKVSRQHSSKLKVDVVRLKKSNVALRRIVAQLQKDNELLLNAEKRRQLSAPVIAPENDTARVSARGIRAMRKKLGLSQTDFGKLAGVSGVSVLQWEKKSGPLKIRDTTRAALLSLRGVGAREAKRRLELVEGKVKGGKVKAAKKSGRGRKAVKRGGKRKYDEGK